MLLLQLNPRVPTSAFRQICEQIVKQIEDGVLRPGDRLPPTRVLARTIGVHRSTVVRAYEEIHALGYLESRSGGYTTVRRRPRPPSTTAREATKETPLVDWRAAATRRALHVHELGMATAPRAGDGVIDFDRAAADPALAPSDDLRRCVREVLLRGRGAALDYADPAGWPPLREVISRRLRTHGVKVGADEILITSGAQQGLDLVLRMLVREGERVIVEAPTYGAAHALLRLHGAKAVEIPVRDDGMDLEALERAISRARPRLVYTMPTFHNPTGITTSQDHRERLLALCERGRVPIVEDGFEEEMKYFGKAVLPVKAIDAPGVVLYVGGFAKVVFPGLRVGWIAAPREAIAILTSIQHASCLAGNTVAQAAMERFCRDGEFEAYLRRVHRVYRRRMQLLLQSLDDHVPPSVTWTRPAGGYTVWLTLPWTFDREAACVDHLARAGVKVAAGRRFFARPPRHAHIRLSIACVGEDQIQEGCRRLGRILEPMLVSNVES